ncbi:MAG TPA: MFS transporter [Geminicoccaceae bacterium]|nr:MFS transporter [Geminicoccus sp.]HMU51380.1 MFS transporter [Geminicoccaceae bacterium]
MSASPFRRNISVLVTCQALFFMANTIQFSTSALVGHQLAPTPLLSTLPLALQFIGIMSTTMPASLLMQRVGRRAGFRLGGLFAVASGALGTYAVLAGSFWLFCLAGVLYGSFGAFSNYLRFAAADAADQSGREDIAAMRPKAIAWVMAGGLVAAVLGPELAKATRDLFAPITFAGCYLAVAVLGAALLLAVSWLDLPPLRATARAGEARSTGELVRDPAIVTAFLAAIVGYVTMNLLMTATPLAMLDCGLSFPDTAFVIQWHVVGMFLPSFWTGRIIARFGAPKVIAVGAVLNLVSIGINMAGLDLANFIAGLFLLGLGWNFMFIGGTALLTQCHRPAEAAKVQGLNDLLMFTTVSLSALTAGVLQQSVGWHAMNLAAIPAVLLILVLLRLKPVSPPQPLAAV